MTPDVVIVTWCQLPGTLYGNLLTLRTVRTGFPTARIRVVDNGSRPEMAAQIAKAARQAGCDMREIAQSLPHHILLDSIIRANGEHPLVICDPDLLFWDSMEAFQTDKVMAGWRIPTFADPYTGTITMSRIHTSFMWIPNPAELCRRVDTFRARYFDCAGWQPVMVPHNGSVIRWDTGAAITDMLNDDVEGWDGPWDGRYDHLFCGTHASLVLDSIPEKYRGPWKRAHKQAVSDPHLVRGIYAVQRAFFSEYGQSMTRVAA